MLYLLSLPWQYYKTTLHPGTAMSIHGWLKCRFSLSLEIERKINIIALAAFFLALGRVLFQAIACFRGSVVHLFPPDQVVLRAQVYPPDNHWYKGEGVTGLAGMKGPKGSFIAYANGPDNVSLGGMGRNSPYTSALLQVIREPGLPIEEIFREVHNRVMEATHEKQVHWESTSRRDLSRPEITKPTVTVGFVAIWWRRGELNPRPQILRPWYYMLSVVFALTVANPTRRAGNGGSVRV